jgi:glycosyltransferase involved in cell wall biosynthesis
MVNEKPNIVAYPPTDRFGETISESEIIERSQGSELRILFLGNVIYRKGLHTLLEAVKDGVLSLSKGQTPKVRVDVIGGITAEPAYAKQIQNFISTNNLSSFVFLHGALDNEPLIEMYKRAHVMIVPSSYEGFGIVYLEGMGFGLPAIGTTAGAASEIINHGEDGYLIEPDDAETLAKHINELASNRALLVELSLNAMKRYQSQPKWDETAKSIREFLYRMIV